MFTYKYIAHRGLHNRSLWAPENSAESIRRAISYNFAIEIDVRLSKDNIPVVFHDSNLLRMTGVDKKVSSLTYEELKNLRLDGTSERIPSLVDVLREVKGKVPLYIDLKGECIIPGKLERQVYKSIKSYNGKVVVMSFNPLRLNYMYKLNKQLGRCQLIVSNSKSLVDKIFLKQNLWKSIGKPDLLGFNKSQININTVVLSAESNCKLLAWTVKSQSELDKIDRLCDKIVFEGFIPDIK